MPTYEAGALKPDAVLTYVNSPKEGSRRGCTLTIVNDESGNRVTLRFRKPKTSTSTGSFGPRS